VARDAVFVAGATGYVGGRLVPLLLARGYVVVAAVRSPGKLKARPYGTHPNLRIFAADVADRASLAAAMQGASVAFYLVHSMGAGGDFAQADRLAATNMAQAAAEAGVGRIIYLSGLGDDAPGLSEHLRSRSEVGRILSEGAVPVTVLRAAVILGSGSASFEIIRNLVERLPVMITPRWVHTRCQPIAVTNVLGYLAGCLENPATSGLTLDIGGPDVITYGELFRSYARAAGIRPPLIIPVPLLTPKLSAFWVNLITPVPAHLVRPLIEGLKNEVVCHDRRILELVPQKLLSCEEAIASALSELSQAAATCCHDAGVPCAPTRLGQAASCPAEWTRAGDPPFAGGSIFRADYAATLDASPAQIWDAVRRIGGDTGWYAGDTLWRLRGLVDKFLGGPGHSRGRRHAEHLAEGDTVDFWRVLVADPGRRLLFLAEMKVPGAATLELRLVPREGGTELMLLTTFQPRGLLGLAYWWAMWPAHGLLFPAMLRNIARAAGAQVLSGPAPLAKRPQGVLTRRAVPPDDKRRGKGHLREGFTTGSAAAAAARAATLFALDGVAQRAVDIPLPPPHAADAGRLTISIASIFEDELGVRAAVIKDAGDDPDATHGARIEAHVTLDPAFSGVGPHVLIGGGLGVGRVTLPGLPVPVGSAAINPGPEAQIRLSVLEVLPPNFKGIALVVIEAPDGEAIARHTLNPRLGILGGISILGTGGVVRPYSHEAWAACIDAALDVTRAAGHGSVVLTTGRRSERLLQERHPFVSDLCLVQAADFFAHAMRQAAARGFREIVWAVFPGKLVKQAQGFENTHARKAELDFVLLADWAREAGLAEPIAEAVAGANTAGQALAIAGHGAAGQGLVELLVQRARAAAQGFAGAGVNVRYVVFDMAGACLYADPVPESIFAPAAPLHPGPGSR
jgi:cobalamin biosynthesis protein CbiD